MRKKIRRLLSVVLLLVLTSCTLNKPTSQIMFPTADISLQNQEVAYTGHVTSNTIAGYTFVTNVETEYSNEPITKQYPPEKPDNGIWVLEKVSDGTVTKIERTYLYTYDAVTNTLLSKVAIPNSEVVHQGTPEVYQYTKNIKVGDSFQSSRVTRYGVDCVGCNVNAEGYGGTAAGIRISKDSVRQNDGSWLPGITYEGYYIIAAPKSIPFCTIVEISNHNFSGQGIQPGVPFKAIVLDRGGSITGTHLDFFIGSERNMNNVSIVGSNKQLTATILGFNQWVKANGNYGCQLP